MYKNSFRIFLFFTLALCAMSARSQSTSNYRVFTRTIDSMTIRLDSLSIIPESFSLTGLEKNDYTINFVSSTLHLNSPESVGKTISCSFRVFSFDLSKKSYHKSSSVIIPKNAVQTPFLMPIRVPSNENSFFDAALQQNGSISRGISIGNRQDFVLNSSLNLQLSGKLTEDIEINANITDKNIPIQAEGNTRVFQDFDKIFIQLNYKDQIKLNAGDIDILKPEGYFLALNKRILGLEVIANSKIKNDNLLYNKAGGGVSKGKFMRNTLTAIEGMQGPYKLTGAQNETYIVILAGSERVYIDGKLLVRGQENDYIIDYNSGEVTFSTRIMITTEKRIIVEFEYTDKNFARYSLYTFNEFTHEKNSRLKFNVNFFHEQDLKNRSIQPELNDEQKLLLSSIGDQTSLAYSPNVDSVAYSSNEVLYKKIDSLVNGQVFSPVYVYSTNSDSAHYRLGFSFTGTNKGNYILVRSSANGRVFQWVAPVSGVPQGNYEPVMLLATPKLNQLGTIAAEYNFLKNTGFKTELAFSNYDQNTFSSKDDGDNVGIAYKIDFFHKNRIIRHKKDTTNWFFNSMLSYEFVHKNFTPIESFRPVEFSRDYNLTDNFAEDNSQNMLQFTAGFAHREIGESKYNLNWFSQYKQLNALKNEIISSTKIKNFLISTTTSFLYTNDSIQSTRFLRTYNQFAKTFRKVELGINENLEYNLFKNAGTDILRPNSYAFNDVSVYVKNNDSLTYKYNILLKNRIDNIAKNNILSTNSIAYEIQGSFEIANIKNNRIRGNATYRNTNLKDTATNQYKSDNNFLGSLEYTGRFFKGALVITTYYEAGSGLEQKKNFSYVKVADGQGNFTWNDYNQNGIEELDEFEVAIFQDKANYIRVWLPSNDFVNTYNNQFTQSILLKPGNVWFNKKGFLKFLARFSNVATFRAYQKNSLKNSLAAFNPFHFNIKDTFLLSSSIKFKNTLSFNQSSPYFGADFIIQRNQGKNLLYNGFESRINNIDEIILRGNPIKIMTLKIDYSHFLKKSNSEYFSSRDYTIETHQIENSIKLQHKNILYGSLLYTYIHKKNLPGSEKSIQHKIELNGNYRIANKGNLNAKLQYIKIKYNDDANNSIGFEMLEGLQAGNNAIWVLSYQTNITDYLQLNIQYEGRASQGSKAVHLGNLQVRAHF